MKKLIIFSSILFILLLPSALEAEDFSFSQIQYDRVGVSLSITYAFKLGSYHLFESWGFTASEARYYSYFVGILAGIAFEFSTNYANTGIKRESSLMGIGLSLIAFRF